MLGNFGIFEIYRLDFKKSEIPLVIFRGTDLSGDGVAGAQIEPLNLRRGNIDIIGAGKIIIIRRAKESISFRENLQHTFGENHSLHLSGSRFHYFENQFRFPKAGNARNIERFGYCQKLGNRFVF